MYEFPSSLQAERPHPTKHVICGNLWKAYMDTYRQKMLVWVLMSEI